MYKLESNDFKGQNGKLFISYHRWEETMPEVLQGMILMLSLTGVIEHPVKEELEILKSKLEYGGYSATITGSFDEGKKVINRPDDEDLLSQLRLLQMLKLPKEQLESTLVTLLNVIMDCDNQKIVEYIMHMDASKDKVQFNH